MWKNGSSRAPNRLRARRTPLAIADTRPCPGVNRCSTRSASPYRIERSTIASVLSEPAIAAPGLYSNEVMRLVTMYTTDACPFCIRARRSSPSAASNMRRSIWHAIRTVVPSW